MTFKQKLMQEHPDCIKEGYTGGCVGYPESYGYEKSDCDGEDVGDVRCAACWNREMPDMGVAIMKRAIDTYGINSQMIIAVEEMSELTKEISKKIRGQDNIDHIAEEIADVEIMLEQLKIAFNLHGYVKSWRERKLDRLGARLSEQT